MSVAELCWFIALVLFLVAELATPSALVSIWFMVGALAALLVSLFCDIFWVQLAVFVIVTALSLILTRPLIMKKVQTQHVATNADQVIGMEGRVTQAIRPLDTGRVQVNGLSWAARCKADIVLEEGTLCIVDAIEGATLTVRAVN